MVLILFCLVSLGFFKNLVFCEQRYDRSKFGTWKDFDNDCLTTKEEIILKSHPIKIKYTPDGCHIYYFHIYCFYTGKLLKGWPSVHLDHALPLYIAWKRGAYLWSNEKRNQFYNDQLNIYAIDKYENIRKSAKPITKYLPPDEGFRYVYLTKYYLTAQKYKIPLTDKEMDVIKKYVDINDIDMDMWN